jgi:hypothetical protein
VTNHLTPTQVPNGLPPVTREWFRAMNQAGNWRITTYPGTPLERTSEVDPYILLSPVGDDPDSSVFFDSHTHELLPVSSYYWDRHLGDSQEEVCERLRADPERFWELPQFDSFDARAELEDFIADISDDDRRQALAGAFATSRPIRNVKAAFTDAEHQDWRGSEEELKEWTLWNFFRAHGVVMAIA